MPWLGARARAHYEYHAVSAWLPDRTQSSLQLCGSENGGVTLGLLVLCRSVRSPASKLEALKVLEWAAKFVDDDIIMQVGIPPKVRRECHQASYVTHLLPDSSLSSKDTKNSRACWHNVTQVCTYVLAQCDTSMHVRVGTM
jgi:hypothetical protein